MDELLREDRDGITTLTLNRPAARNALSTGLLEALERELGALAADPAARVVVLAGNGPAFSAGHDLRELRGLGEAGCATLFALCSRVMQRIVHLPSPVVARVHGMATAAGCQLVASCDLAIASTAARFATPGVNIGLFCTTPSVALSRDVSRKHAMQMLLTGEAIDAATAERFGLVNQVVPERELDQAVLALARLIASKPADTIALGKQAFNRQRELELGPAYEYASAIMTRNMLAPEAREGIDAFLARRR